ncbi:DeoR family transcriptional regulator, partial [Escherichia coli]
GEHELDTSLLGVVGRGVSAVNTAIEQREVSQTVVKNAIDEAVADYIPDGSTIFITIGTTVEHVARALLNHNHLRIITNSLRVAHILYHNPRFEVMVPGG